MFDLTIKDYTVLAGGRIKLQIPSDFFQIMEATGSVNVDFYKEHARVGFAEGVGQGFRLGPVADTFHGVEIYSATAQTLKLCFSRGNVPVDLSQVVSVTGTVSIINGELTRVLNNEAFTGAADVVAVAGQYARAQLLNPVGSGINLVVRRVSMLSTTSAEKFRIITYGTSIGGSLLYALNKNLAGAQGSSELRGATGASVLTTEAIRLQVVAGAVNTLVDVPLAEPLFVPPGYGIVVENNTVNTHLNATFQWFEEAI